jgi:hypothetical protein
MLTYADVCCAARALERYTRVYADGLVDEVLFDDVSRVADEVYRLVLREKAEAAAAAAIDVVLENVVRTVGVHAGLCASRCAQFTCFTSAQAPDADACGDMCARADGC